jgi:oligoribonuclease NrnB/cAMP/cGMP phosphodiesterase (DHH superfamily)
MQVDGKNDTFENTRASYITKILSDDIDKLTIKYLNYKGILTYSMGNISILANSFLKVNTDVDFFMDINRKGRISLRSSDRLDVSKLAFDISGGGGHKNAAGAVMKDFKENIFYLNINNFVQQKLDDL